MEFLLRLLLIIVKFSTRILNAVHNAIRGPQQQQKPESSCLPAITNRLLTLSAQELRTQLRSRQLTAVELVTVYIERIKAVNSQLNAVVEDRFEAALLEAAAVDKRIAAAGDVEQLFERQPLLGLPVTVKESCALAGMSFAVGSLARSKMRADSDGAAVGRVRAAGAIPLLVSATPEYCFSIDTDTLLNGRCRNPYDLKRTPGGSSGGEGALNGAGASLFGIGSDIGGSIRIPSLFCGVFGHKPTGGVVSVAGHFPNSDDADFANYLVLGPITRFAVDLALLLEVMAGENASQLHLHDPQPQLGKLRVLFSTAGFVGLNGRMHHTVDRDIKRRMRDALSYLVSIGLQVKRAQLPAGFNNSMEIAMSSIARLQQMPYALGEPTKGSVCETLVQVMRSLLKLSNHTTNALIFDLLRRAKAFMPGQRLEYYQKEAQTLAVELTSMLTNYLSCNSQDLVLSNLSKQELLYIGHIF
ncbi:fatty-acid amide hydrolase 2-A isoform X2 [Drosophila grimshawi]|uniref:fatty-acid amide hydrolase 2-A isoform X2 n=1 Tax=Drosophila grimshawi TaxID=7222 RepID=UPI000C870B59|nr:fatty-acid amide hydrolase 2-A isoform X2 [Drosophila grimshawi]